MLNVLYNMLYDMLFSCFENQCITKHNLSNVLHNILYMMVYISIVPLAPFDETIDRVSDPACSLFPFCVLR